MQLFMGHNRYMCLCFLPLVYFLSLPFLTHTAEGSQGISCPWPCRKAMSPSLWYATPCTPQLILNIFTCVLINTVYKSELTGPEAAILVIAIAGGFHSTVQVEWKGVWMTLWKVWRPEAKIESTKVKEKHSSSPWLIVREGKTALDCWSEKPFTLMRTFTWPRTTVRFKHTSPYAVTQELTHFTVFFHPTFFCFFTVI